jgi:hypothetical protein
MVILPDSEFVFATLDWYLKIVPRFEPIIIPIEL